MSECGFVIYRKVILILGAVRIPSCRFYKFFSFKKLTLFYMQGNIFVITFYRIYCYFQSGIFHGISSIDLFHYSPNERKFVLKNGNRIMWNREQKMNSKEFPRTNFRTFPFLSHSVINTILKIFQTSRYESRFSHR